MSRSAIFFLVVGALGLAIVIVWLGLARVQTNLMGWFLLTGISYLIGVMIVYWFRRERFWGPRAGGAMVKEERRDRSFWMIVLGMLAAFFLPPVEYTLLPEILPRANWMQATGLTLIILSVILFIWARRTFGNFYSGHVLVVDGQPLAQSGPYRFIRHPAYSGYLLTSLDLLACPPCREKPEFSCADPIAENCRTGNLYCRKCSMNYSIVDGIPHFTQPEQLTELNRRFARAYDWSAWAYRAFSKIAFAYIYIGMEETGRREITDRLGSKGGRVLEVSVGSGVNLPYLVNRPDVGEVFGMDISLGQLKNCQHYVAKKGWGVNLFLGNGEQLPFRDEAFDGVFHVDGINFFNNKKSAIEEMIRVAKPGTRILIADETEKGARGYEKLGPGFKNLFDGKREMISPPIDLVPKEMFEARVFDAWKG